MNYYPAFNLKHPRICEFMIMVIQNYLREASHIHTPPTGQYGIQA